MSTLTERAYTSLRHDIVRGLWSPGQQLRMSELSASYEMGFSPLREALSRLQAEGLVVLAPLRGFSVASLSIKEMWETINLRILIECEALRLSIANGGDDWEAGIVSTLHALNLQHQRLDNKTEQGIRELEERHRAFHMQLLSACNSLRMLTLIERLYAETERYRIPILLQSDARQGRDLQREHADIADAALGRKVELATSRLTEHYRDTGRVIEERSQKEPIMTVPKTKVPKKATAKRKERT